MSRIIDPPQAARDAIRVCAQCGRRADDEPREGDAAIICPAYRHPTAGAVVGPHQYHDVSVAGAEAVAARRLVDQAIDHVERAAVCLAGALEHVPNAGVPTDGTQLILEGTRDDLRRRRDGLRMEREALVDAYAHALRRTGAQR